MKEEENNIDFDELVCQINENDMSNKKARIKARILNTSAISLLLVGVIVQQLIGTNNISQELGLILFVNSVFSLYLHVKAMKIFYSLMEIDFLKEMEMIKELKNENKNKGE